MNDYKLIRIVIRLILLPTLFLAFGVQAANTIELTRNDFRASVCNIESLSINFKVDQAFGEPLLTSKMRWTAGANTSADCLSGITHIWIRTRTESDTLLYIKLRPRILPANEPFGDTTTESPNWGTLFCDGPSDSSICKSSTVAKSLVASNLKHESFEVITQALAVSTLNQTAQIRLNVDREPGREPDDGEFLLDSLLADAIDKALGPENGSSNEMNEAPAPIREEKPPELTAEQINAQKMTQQAKRAEAATDTITLLISTSLSEYRTPAHTCESPRSITNWIKSQGSCSLNIRSESTHDYLCAQDRQPRAMKSTKLMNIDLSRDIKSVSDIRQSSAGWASLAIEFNEELQTTSEGNYQTNRWQITVNESQLDDLKRLAGSLITLKEYCEAGAV